MKFPYGVSDFYKIVTEGFFYVDRTDRIPLLEKAGGHLLFLRPRRFGKSLLLSMLKNYYDVAKADEFDRMFGHLVVGQQPTALHNQYFVLEWDFSAVNPVGNAQQIQQSLYDYVNERIIAFAKYYRVFLTDEIRINPTNALASFQSLLTAIQQTSHKLYLFIDEYDNFANEIMMGPQEINRERYKALVYGEGVLKVLFKVVKSATKGEGLDRAFITGVSPVVMSHITSGHNIAENISLPSEFKDLCGFLESEVVETLKHIVKECHLPEEKTTEALEMMQTFYNGYCFSYHSDTLVYNPTLVLYFMKAFQNYCQYPEEMLDENLAMDRGKITYISQLPHGDRLILNALNDKEPLSIQRLARRFGVEDMLHAVKDHTFMASLLYYFGVLTFGGRTPQGKHILQVPNLVVRGLYLEQIQEMLLPDLSKDEALQAAETFYSTGDMQPLCEFVEQRYFKVFDNRDYRWANELTVKTAFFTLLFNDTFYLMDSETALERGYADLTMIIRPDMRQYQLLDILIEFKYVSLTEAGLRGEQVKRLSMEELKAVSAVQDKLSEAKMKLKTYRHGLEIKYGKGLRLHTYSVVAVGFDRLIWEEIMPEHQEKFFTFS